MRGWRARSRLVPEEEAELRLLGMLPQVCWHHVIYTHHGVILQWAIGFQLH